MLDRADWARDRAALRAHDLFLLYDAAMEAIVFDGREPVSPLEHEGMAERTVIAGSMSKAYRMIGWRVGWIAGPDQIVSDAGWVHVYNTTGAVSVARKAAEAVLRGPQEHVADATPSCSAAATRSSPPLPAWPIVRPAGGWSLLVEAAAPARGPSAAMLEGRRRRDADDRLGRFRRRALRPLRLQRGAGRRLKTLATRLN